jgi:carbon storage regulator CsrA
MALCLTRRPGQTLILGRQQIRITVDSVVGKTVKIVIDAPRHIPIVREELVYRAAPQPQEEK